MTECPWCTVEFAPARRGAYAKRFCSAGCRNQFNSAKRKFIDALMSDGDRVIREWNAVSTSCTTAGVPPEPSGVGRGAMNTLRVAATEFGR